MNDLFLEFQVTKINPFRKVSKTGRVVIPVQAVIMPACARMTSFYSVSIFATGQFNRNAQKDLMMKLTGSNWKLPSELAAIDDQFL